MKQKFIFAVLAFLLIISISTVLADQYVLLCLHRGETVEFSECNPRMDDRTCGSDYGCPYCTILKDSGVYCPASINVCNNLGLACSYLNNTIIDTEPPTLTMHSPVNNAVYDARAVLLDFDVDELANVYYYDNINGSGRWSRICTGCSDYSRKLSFREGFNNITLRASDVLGNSAYRNLNFFVDSKEPRIKKTNPKKGFANGAFEAQFTEENPKSLVLYYGNSQTGYRNRTVSLTGEACNYDQRNLVVCTPLVNLASYNQQSIEYWFVLKDISNKQDESNRISLAVDTTSPVITNMPNIYSINGKYVTFRLQINERNFYKVNYIAWNNSRTPRWQTLCSKLTDGVCEKKVTFKPGSHIVDIEVLDQAGNKRTVRVAFSIS